MAEPLRAPTPAGGWGRPWPDVAELAAAVPAEAWTLIGGLMVQLHGVLAGLPVVRPTDDVDVLLHVETGRGRATQLARALEGLGYALKPSIDARTGTAHRFVRAGAIVDLVTSGGGGSVVDVLLACVDPFEERTPSGSDRSRLLHLREQLADPTAPAWLLLPDDARRNGQVALDLLTA